MLLHHTVRVYVSMTLIHCLYDINALIDIHSVHNLLNDMHCVFTTNQRSHSRLKHKRRRRRRSYKSNQQPPHSVPRSQPQALRQEPASKAQYDTLPPDVDHHSNGSASTHRDGPIMIRAQERRVMVERQSVSHAHRPTS